MFLCSRWEAVTSDFDHTQGRPTKGEQLNIERTLRPYFENSISATFTAFETRFDKKTVLKYFNQWKEEILETENPEFFKKCKEEKQRCLLTYEKQISSLVTDKKEIELLIEAFKKTCDLSSLEKFYKLKLKITETIVKFVSDRINLVNAVTADTVFELEKKVEKNGN